MKDIDVLYRENAHALFSYALGLGFDRETAMDAIHDVFFKMCQRESLLDGVINIRFYLLRSLKNRLLNISKQQRDVIELPFDYQTEQLPFTLHVTVEDALIRTEEDEKTRLQIETLLRSLTDRQREIIYLRYTQECSYEEIAQLMEITVPACRKLFHKALTKLKENAGLVIYFLSTLSY